MIVISDFISLCPSIVAIEGEKEFVAIFNDNFAHTENAVRMGLVKEGDKVMFTFFNSNESLTCVIGINDGGNPSKHIANFGQRVSYEPWCCGGCGIATDRRLKCGACRCAVYCSKDCQREAWTNHKFFCGA